MSVGDKPVYLEDPSAKYILGTNAQVGFSKPVYADPAAGPYQDYYKAFTAKGIGVDNASATLRVAGVTGIEESDLPALVAADAAASDFTDSQYDASTGRLSGSDSLMME